MSKKNKARVILAGDIGGTKTRLGLFSISGESLRSLSEQTFPSKDYDSVETIIRTFLKGREKVSIACLGVAGPIVEGIAIATNLPWTIAEKTIEQSLHIKKTVLINDLVANAYGIGVLKGKDFEVLNIGKKQRGNAAVLSAGTGLGAAVLFWDGMRYLPSPSEGGHVEFGPRNRLELELLQYLFDLYGHVSYERILSGAGLFNIYQFLRGSGRFGAEPDWLSDKMKREDPAASIAETAVLKKDKCCEETLDLFVSIYGAAAGNLALQVMAVSGVYIGGGIAPKIIGKLKNGTFVNAFRNKGRLSSIVERIPVRVIMNDRAAVLGAAAYAADLAQG
jgi:glucokinase